MFRKSLRPVPYPPCARPTNGATHAECGHIEAAVRARIGTLTQDLTGAFEVAALYLRSSLTHSWRVIDISQPRVSVLPVAKMVESTK